jgi:GT2 family glycosyltransferase
MSTANIRLGVGFATCGRAAVLNSAIAQLRDQTVRPGRIFVCYTKPADIEGVRPQHDIVFILSPPGLPRQRNAILAAAAGAFDVMLFLDDDFLVDRRYVETVAAVFSANPDIVVATGLPYADDVKGPGLTAAEARRMIADAAETAVDLRLAAAPHGYGCNMAIRMGTASAYGVWFDENLPLYGWSEDVDFSHRLGRHGKIVKLQGARGVHLGVKSGRGSGRRLGYSQVANPLYLRGKGSYSWRRAAASVGRNLAANLARALWSEPYIDRRGRLLGNVLAFGDLLRGRLAPGRVLEL